MEKRQRERDKQLKRQAKQAKRLERNAIKREAKLNPDANAAQPEDGSGDEAGGAPQENEDVEP
jgi:hypothetical protein